MIMEKKWWHKSVIYQIYPRSFKDTTGSGIGDLRGIITKLDYLKKLGIDIIWLSPVYASPMDDNGYDIRDYYAVDSLFGTMEDMECLIHEGKKRGIYLMMDLVVNHTSDEHPWFLESKSSLDNPKRDWYIWRSPKEDGSPPNNWGSYFTRSAWEYDDTTGEYYLHLFSKKQPDLNWANEDVRQAVYDMMHWWLQKGIRGFRMDVINMIGKPSDFRDASIMDEGVPGWEYWANNSRTHEYLREMHDQVLQHYDIVTVGETPYVTPREGKFYSHPHRKELDMIFQFEHMNLDKTTMLSAKKPLDLIALKSVLSKWQNELHLKGWNSNYWSNHDQARAVSRFGNEDPYRVESAKMLGTLLHFMPGTPYVYQGEEIGFTNTYYDTIEDYNDLMDHHKYDVMVHDYKLTGQEALKRIQPFSRDNGRVPMCWDSSDGGGFTKGSPWLKLNPYYQAINVKQALDDSNSVFYYYQQLIQLRKDSVYSPIIVYGDYTLIMPEHDTIFAYIRQYQEQKLLILTNFSESETQLSLPYRASQVVISNANITQLPDLSHLTMKPYEALVVVI